MASYSFTQHDLKSLPLVALFNRVALCSQEFLTNIFSFSSATQRDDSLVVCAIFQNRRGFFTGEVYSPISISNVGGSCGEIVLDYGRCEGGVPVFEISMATSENETLKFDVIYSETREGIDNEQGTQGLIVLIRLTRLIITGDGPFFLFSNAMNTYRRESYKFKASDAPTKLEARYTQQSQRYQ